MTGKYEIRIGKCLQTAWENFLKAPEIFILLALGVMASWFVLSRVPMVGPAFSLVIFALATPAFFILAEHARNDRPVTFSSLVELVPVAPQLIVICLVKGVMATLGFILFVLPGIYVLVIYTFADIIATLEKKTFWESMELSREIVRQNWVGVLGLSLVCFLIVCTGALFVGVGLLAAMPVSALLIHAVYHDIRAQVSGLLPSPE